jgi:hypothetical protein
MLEDDDDDVSLVEDEAMEEDQPQIQVPILPFFIF